MLLDHVYKKAGLKPQWNSQTSTQNKDSIFVNNRKNELYIQSLSAMKNTTPRSTTKLTPQVTPRNNYPSEKSPSTISKNNLSHAKKATNQVLKDSSLLDRSIKNQGISPYQSNKSPLSSRRDSSISVKQETKSPIPKNMITNKRDSSPKILSTVSSTKQQKDKKNSSSSNISKNLMYSVLLKNLEDTSNNLNTNKTPTKSSSDNLENQSKQLNHNINEKPLIELSEALAPFTPEFIQLRQSVIDNQDIRQKIKNIPQIETENVESLAKALSEIHNNTDIEKSWVVFYWISQNIEFNVTGSTTSNDGDSSAEEVIKSKSGVCEGYAALFTKLCELLSLEVKKISGYSKNNLNTSYMES